MPNSSADRRAPGPTRSRRPFATLWVVLFVVLLLLPAGTAWAGAQTLPPAAAAGELAAPQPAHGRLGEAARPAAPSSGAGSSPSQGNWSLIPANPSPPPAQSGSMIYDPVAGEFVLFSGVSEGNPQGSTWVYSHGNWTNISANLSTAPSPRWYDTFVWDAADGYGLLFGGRNDYIDLNDTWAFNGSAWREITTTVAPPPMTTGRAAYDAADGYVWMFGGFSIMPGAPSAYNATWTYRAGVWDNITASVTGAPPDPHAATYAVYDSTDGYVVMYGGSISSSGSCTLGGNTWLYSGGVYTNLTSTIGPSPPVSLGSRMMADDPAIGGVVLYGGWDGGSCVLSNQTWVYSAGVWSQEVLSWNPGPLWDGEIAGDGPNGSVLLFSGNTVANTATQSTETWGFTTGLEASISGALAGDAPYTVHLTSSVQGVAPFTYQWNWGDGSLPNTTAAASHTYVTPGTYEIELVVHNSQGNVARAFANATAVPPLAIDAQATPSVGLAPLAVAFGVQPIGGLAPYTYVWSFGVGGSTASGASADFTYELPGHYAPTLQITDSDGHQIISQLSITAVQALSVSVAGQPSQTVTGTPVAFQAMALDGLGPFTYAWNFGDGSQLSGAANESHTYSGGGTFAVSVTVADQLGEVKTASTSVQVALPLVVSLVTNPSSAVLGQAITLTAELAGGTPPETESWSGLPPGCPASPTGLAVSCTPTAAGIFHVTIWVNDSQGQSRHANTTVTISAASSGPGASTPWILWAGVGVAVAAIVIVAVAVLARTRRPPKA